MVVLRATVASMVLWLGACGVGEVPIGGGGTPDGGGGTPSQTFDAQIKPLVMTTHPCLGCHSTTQGPILTSYDTLAAKYKTKPGTGNILVTKGDHQNTTYFTAAEKTTVAAWIDMYGM